MGERGIREPLLGLTRVEDDTVSCVESRHGKVQLLRCEFAKNLPSLGRRAPEHWTEHCDAHRTEGAQVPWTEVGIAHDDVDR